MIDFFIQTFKDVPAWFIATKQVLDQINEMPFFKVIGIMALTSGAICLAIQLSKNRKLK